MTGNKNSGRRNSKNARAGVQSTIDVTAPEAMTILRRFINRERSYKKLDTALQRACEYVIDHAIGKARQKVEHSGGIMTYGELAKSADTIDNKPRRVLADALEIARHHQEETPAPNEVASSEE